MSANSTSSHAADPRLSRLFDFIPVGSGLRPYFFLSFLCALLYLPGISAIPPTDRDEARFMQATKQMIESGDYVHIRFQNEPRNKKPAGIHWLQAAAVKLAGQNLTTHWPYRLPSVLAAWIAVLATCYLGNRLFGPGLGLPSAAVLATSFMTVVEAHIAKTDAALLACTTVALGALAIIYVKARKDLPTLSVAMVFWVALAGGTLIKGPVTLAVALTTIAALVIADRDARWLKSTHPLLGIPLTLLLTLPWLMTTSGSDSENNFFVEAIRGDLIPKLIGGQESHGAPPGTHLVAGLLTAWPWSLLVPFALFAGWRHRTAPAVRFCLAWLTTTWVLFELVPTKLPHYTLPAFPAFALLVAWSAQEGTLWTFYRSPAGWIYRGFWMLVTLVLAGAVVFAAAQYGAPSLIPALVAALALAGGAVLAIRNWRTAAGATGAMAYVAMLFAVVLSAVVVPRLDDLAVSTHLAQAVSRHHSATDTPVALAGYSEPSIVFLLGTDTILTSTASVIAHVRRHPGSIGIVESDQVDRIAQALEGSGLSLHDLETVDGYNYSRGRAVHLSVVTVAPPESQP